MVVSADADQERDPNNAKGSRYLNFMIRGGLCDPAGLSRENREVITAFILRGPFEAVKYLSEMRNAFFLSFAICPEVWC